MKRRRMMMAEGLFWVFLDFSLEQNENVFVEFCGTKYRSGIIRCREGDIITCKLNPGNLNSAIYLDGERIGEAFPVNGYELSVMGNVRIRAEDGNIYITTK
ncbi:MAG: hypothetical protein IJE28_00400 [Oscillospiraceae bacterium]|nr:hypothetical protein [Oscillospiraceae bacterium]MBQ3499978.1 hypothetical protein [Oscillospiraceae bacterium]